MLRAPSNKPVLEAFRLHGKTALVTGAARGIGLEVARGLAEAGANVALHYRTSNNGEEMAAKIAQDSGGAVKAAAYQADISDPSANDELVNKVLQDFGGLDVVVVNAGVSDCFHALDCSAETYRRQVAVNLDGAFYTAQAAAEVFKARGVYDNIIFTTSMSARIVNGPQNQSVCKASKAGLVHLAKSLTVEWSQLCRVNCVSPGCIATEMIDSDPEEGSEFVPVKSLRMLRDGVTDEKESLQA